MANHKLSLESPETLNVCILRLQDTSVYNEDVTIKCPLLSITLPGFNYSVEFDETEIAPGFNLNLTACDLEIQTLNCGSKFEGLPDGIYVIRYSVSPNDLVYVEYNHLRRTKALLCYNEALCDLDIAACAPDSETEAKLKELNFIKMYLDAAKAVVEICHNPKRGMELYSYAVKLLGKFNCKTCQK